MLHFKVREEFLHVDLVALWEDKEKHGLRITFLGTVQLLLMTFLHCVKLQYASWLADCV